MVVGWARFRTNHPTLFIVHRVSYNAVHSSTAVFLRWPEVRALLRYVGTLRELFILPR